MSKHVVRAVYQDASGAFTTFEVVFSSLSLRLERDPEWVVRCEMELATTRLIADMRRRGVLPMPAPTAS